MEPISGVASILSILEATACVSKSITELCRNLRDAPRELAQLSTRISQTRSRIDIQVNVYQRFSEKDLSALLPAGTLKTLQADLDDAIACLKKVQDTLSSKWTNPSGKQRFIWVVQDKRRIAKVIQNFRDIDDNLSALCMTLSLALSLRSHELINQLGTDQRALTVNSGDGERGGDVALDSMFEPTAHGIYRHGHAQTAPAHQTASSTAGSRSRPLGKTPSSCEGWKAKTSLTIGYQQDDLRSIYWMLAFIRLPYFLSSYAFSFAVQLWLFRVNWPCLRHSLALKNVIPVDSGFINACAVGDTKTVIQLSLSGHGTPSSLDEMGQPALHHAIRSGSFELVHFLLHNGATANDLDSRCYWSPLQLACRYGYSDIARLLLAKGAFLEHADGCSRTAFTMLWFELSRPFLRTDLLRILLAHSPMPFILDAPRPVSPLACAAMKGSVSDLRLLMQSNLYTNHRDTVGDGLIIYSIFGSNPATYDFLLPFTSNDWISRVDYRGRTPLHLALEYPSAHVRDIVKRLLDAGADVFAKDEDGNEPGDLARICDEKVKELVPQLHGTLQAYYEALGLCGFEVEIDQDKDLWWLSEQRGLGNSEGG